MSVLHCSQGAEVQSGHREGGGGGQRPRDVEWRPAFQGRITAADSGDCPVPDTQVSRENTSALIGFEGWNKLFHLVSASGALAAQWKIFATQRESNLIRIETKDLVAKISHN